VVLAGGGGVRLGGVDKASIELDGQTLLERALAATSAAEETVAVGTGVPTSRPVTWTREDPPGGGPAAGLLAGLDALGSPREIVAVLAVDMPRVTAATVGRLVDVLCPEPEADGACLVDAAGHRQPLAAVYRYASLVGARPTHAAAEHGLSIRRLLAPLRLIDVPALGAEGRDVDTWADLRDLRP
jgi:molybdopterin-guanine dinucleotide biosynthesis protein A